MKLSLENNILVYFKR